MLKKEDTSNTMRQLPVAIPSFGGKVREERDCIATMRGWPHNTLETEPNFQLSIFPALADVMKKQVGRGRPCKTDKYVTLQAQKDNDRSRYNVPSEATWL